MQIDINQIGDKGLIIDDIISFDSTYLDKTSIKKLDNVIVKGKIYYNLSDEILFDCNIKGCFILEDSISLDLVEYPFDIEISQNLSEFIANNKEKNTKRLDIMDILWQNIVLEVPISYTITKDSDKELSGEGWELVSEEKNSVDPRLAPLLELLDNQEGVK